LNHAIATSDTPKFLLTKKFMEDFHPTLLPGFNFRAPQDKIDEKLLADVHRHGWHVVAVLGDEEGPEFAYTVGLYLRTLQPEILMMGVPAEPSGRVLNVIGEYLIAGGEIVPGERYPGFVDGRDVLFRQINRRHYHDYLGCANWFYRPHPDGYPALQCVWPDLEGVFPDEEGFEERFRKLQIDLSM
jgi:hypothetical protein